VKFKEFLKELAGSVKKGRIHKILRLLMVGLFLYLGAVVGKELVTYYLEKKREIHLSVTGLRWDFSLRSGELSVEFDSLELKTPSTRALAERGAVTLDLYDSIFHLRPHLENLEVERLAVISSGKGKKGVKIPSVTLNRLRVGQLLYRKEDLSVFARQILKTETEVAAGGLIVEKRDKKITVLPFKGYLKDGFYHIPLITVAYDKALLSGSAKISQNLREGQFEGLFSSEPAELNLSVKFHGSLVTAKGEGRVLKKHSQFSLRGKLGREEFNLNELSGSWNGVGFNLKGRFKRETFRLSGRYWAPSFEEAGYTVKGLRGRLEAEGSYKEPVISSEFNVQLFSTGLLDLERVSGTGELTLKGGKISFSSPALAGKISYRGKGEELSGSLELKGFSLYRLKPVKAAAKKYRGWVPGVVLSGPVRFDYIKRTGELFYRGSLKIDSFRFQNYSATGGVRFGGSRNSVRFNLGLSGNKGLVKGSGTLNLKGRVIDSSFEGSSLRVDAFTFLKRAGLAGAVDGSGSVRGKLKNPEALFEFSGRHFTVQGVSLSPLEGRLSFKDMVVRVWARSSKGVEVDELSYDVKRGLFSLKGSAENFSARALQKILAGYKVRLPFVIDGSITGGFSVNLSLKKRPVEVQVVSQIENFTGTFLYGNLVELSTPSTRGEVRYSGRELFALFEGRVKRGSFKEVEFSGGSYLARVEGSKVGVSYQKVSLNLPKVDRVLSSGKVAVELKEQKIDGNFDFQFSVKRDFVEAGGTVKAVVEGRLSTFTVKISGEGKVESPYLKEGVRLRVEGVALEPENTGNVRIYGDRADLRLLLFGKEARLVGKVRSLELQLPRAEAKVNLAFVNLELPEVAGSISIPAFTVKPYGFYKLYSPTGVYIDIDGGKVRVSDFSLSYVDGWIEFKDVSLEPVRARFEGELGAKGLVYLFKLNRVIPFARNAFRVNGEFVYDGQLSYRAEVVGDGVVFKSRFILDRVLVNTLRAEIKNGELLKLNGELTAGDGTVLITKTDGEVAIALSQVPVGQIEEWKSLVSGNLSASLEKKKLAGSLELSRTKLFFRKKEETETPGQEEEETRLPAELQIDILFDEPVRIKGELFWIEILPTLKAITVNGRPVIAGNFYATDGEIDYMGKKFKVLYGSGTIEDLKRKKGRVSILASAHISGYYVYMKIEGPLTSPTIYLTSDPPLTREEIMNLIMTGASPEQIEASSEIFPAVQIAYYAASSFFKPIESKFQKALGLESFTVEPYITRYGETVAKLTITKRLTERIRLIGYGTTGQNPEYGGSIDFYITDKYYLELRYNSYYKTEVGIGFEVNLR